MSISNAWILLKKLRVREFVKNCVFVLLLMPFGKDINIFINDINSLSKNVVFGFKYLPRLNRKAMCHLHSSLDSLFGLKLNRF